MFPVRMRAKPLDPPTALRSLELQATQLREARGSFLNSVERVRTDLAALGSGTGQTPNSVPVQKPPAPPMDAVPPPSHCQPGDKPEPSVDGRVPAGSATDGLWCNVTLLSHQGTSGGFKVYRYVDAGGHECAYYDTALLFPLNALNPAGTSLGVAVLDMSDHAHPVQTATLTDPVWTDVPISETQTNIELSVAGGASFFRLIAP